MGAHLRTALENSRYLIAVSNYGLTAHSAAPQCTSRIWSVAVLIRGVLFLDPLCLQHQSKPSMLESRLGSPKKALFKEETAQPREG